MCLPKGEAWNLEAIVVSRFKGILYELDAINICISTG